MVAPDSCFSLEEDEKTNCSGLFSVLYEVTPLNPLTHPMKAEDDFDV